MKKLLFLILIVGCGQSSLKEDLLFLHNKERQTRNLSNFKLDPNLCDHAQKHSNWMAKNNKLKHSNIQQLNYDLIAENIAWNKPTAEVAVKDWMNSKGHRINILNKNLTKIGFGLAKNHKGESFWCVCFSR